MNAVISGSAGVALLVDGDRLSSIDVGALEVVVPRSTAEIRLLFGDSGDFQFHSGIELDEVKRRLMDAHRADDALHLTLILLDPEVPSDIQEEAAGELSELLMSERTQEHLEGILYAKPLPDSMDVSGAIRCCRAGVESHERAADLLERLRDRQAVICEVRDAWEAIPASILSDEERPAAEGAAARSGLSRSLVLTRIEGGNIDAWLALALQDPAARLIRNSRVVLQRWITPLQSERISLIPALSDDDDWSDEADEAPDREPDRRSGARPLLSVRRIFEHVESRKQAIVQALDRQNPEQAKALIKELVSYQLRHGGPSFASKSLCHLAIEAQRRSLFALQLELTGWSVELSPNDAWSWRQHGKALLNADRSLDALAAYDQALGLGGDVVAKSGRAEGAQGAGSL